MPKVNEKTITRSRAHAHRAFPTPRLSEDVISFSMRYRSASIRTISSALLFFSSSERVSVSG